MYILMNLKNKAGFFLFCFSFLTGGAPTLCADPSDSELKDLIVASVFTIIRWYLNRNSAVFEVRFVTRLFVFNFVRSLDLVQPSH